MKGQTSKRNRGYLTLIHRGLDGHDASRQTSKRNRGYLTPDGISVGNRPCGRQTSKRNRGYLTLHGICESHFKRIVRPANGIAVI